MTVNIPDTPTTEAPITETPTTETPKTETPVVETPSTEAPMETPITETPSPEAITGACETEFLPGAITSTLREFVGTPSCGYEYLEYALSGGILIILFAFIATVINGFSKVLGAK